MEEIPMVDVRRKNGALIILKTNSGKIIPLERLWGKDVMYEGDIPGPNCRRWKFYGWIEIDKSLNTDKTIFEGNNPISILLKARNGDIAKYVYCKLVDRPVPPSEKSDNDQFAIECTTSLCIPELNDLQ
jgi:hypothetical protein